MTSFGGFYLQIFQALTISLLEAEKAAYRSLFALFHQKIAKASIIRSIESIVVCIVI